METLPSHRNVIALAILALLLPLSFLGGYQLGEVMTEERIKVGPYEGQGIRVQLEVYKNGELMFVDYDDPPTWNFAVYLAYLFEGSDIDSSVSPNRNYQPVDIGGNAAVVADIIPSYATVFISYDSTYAYNFNMFALPSSYDTASIANGAVIIDSTNKTIQFSATVTASQTATVYGVGVYVYMQWDVGSTQGYRDYVMFYDDLGANAFTVNANDVVTVVYKIVLP